MRSEMVWLKYLHFYRLLIMELEASMSRIMTQRYCTKMLTFLNMCYCHPPILLFHNFMIKSLHSWQMTQTFSSEEAGLLLFWSMWASIIEHIISYIWNDFHVQIIDCLQFCCRWVMWTSVGQQCSLTPAQPFSQRELVKAALFPHTVTYSDLCSHVLTSAPSGYSGGVV